MSTTATEPTTGTDVLAAPPPKVESAGAMSAGFDSAGGLALLQRGAQLLASSTLVPKEYQGNLPNCVIALNMAQRLGADPLMVMQNLYVVHGRPSWSAQFLIATFNQNGRFFAIRYAWEGERGTDKWGCRAYTVEKATGEKLEGALITMALAKAEGWIDKTGSKWKTMPEQMLMYRSAAWLVRAIAPEIAMGLQTAEELHDTIETERGADGVYQPTNGKSKLDQLTDTLKSATQACGDGQGRPSVGLLLGVVERQVGDVVALIMALETQAEMTAPYIKARRTSVCGTEDLATADPSALDDYRREIEALIARLGKK